MSLLGIHAYIAQLEQLRFWLRGAAILTGSAGGDMCWWPSRMRAPFSLPD